MDTRIVDHRISCPYCGEPMEVVIDMSAGSQSYIEDCQICCRPMQISFETEGEYLSSVAVDTAD